MSHSKIINRRRFNQLTLSGAVGSIFNTGLLSVAATPAEAKDNPIRIGFIYNANHVMGQSMRNGAELAVSEIQPAGGIAGRPINIQYYNAEADPSKGVRAIQQAVERDKAEVVMGVWSSDVQLAIMPWAKRLNVPVLISGGVTPKLTELIHKDYEQYKNIFRLGILNSVFQAEACSETSKQILQDQLGLKRVALLVEEATWTGPFVHYIQEHLPQHSNLDLVGTFSFPISMTDFTALYAKIAAAKPDALIGGFAYSGTAPVVQWAQLKPAPYMTGLNGELTGGDFFKRTNGAANGAMSWITASVDAPITQKTLPFVKNYQAKFHVDPLFQAFSSYDTLYRYKLAVEQEKTTRVDAIVANLERESYLGAVGRIRLLGRDEPYTHDTAYGSENGMTGVTVQWQKNGELHTIWPKSVAATPIQRA